MFVYILFMPEKGFGVRFKSYHSTLDDFTDETIENSVVSKRRKELKFSDIDLYRLICEIIKCGMVSFEPYTEPFLRHE